MRRDNNVAGGCSHDFQQRRVANARADRAHVRVECADRDRRARFQAEPRRPFFRQRSGRRVRRAGLFEQPIFQPAQERIELDQKRLVRQAAPRFMPHRLVSGGAPAALHRERIGVAGQQRGHPVAMLHPRKRRLADVGVFAQHAQNFRPEPFRRIDAALEFREIRAAPMLGKLVDFFGFFDAGVVFPENEHGVRVVRKFRLQRERRPVAVNRARRRAGRVNADADHMFRHAGRKLG